MACSQKVKQAFNRKTGAWVKYTWDDEDYFIPLDVKQHNPRTPFKGVKKTKRR